jgi:hypothetical protein
VKSKLSVLWEACELDVSQFAEKYSYIVAVLIPHGELMRPDDYNENA